MRTGCIEVDPSPPWAFCGKRWLAQFLSASSATRSLATLTRFHSRIEHTMRAAMLSIWTLYGTSQRHQRQKCTECPCNFYIKKTNKKTAVVTKWLQCCTIQHSATILKPINGSSIRITCKMHLSCTLYKPRSHTLQRCVSYDSNESLQSVALNAATMTRDESRKRLQNTGPGKGHIL